MSYPLKLRHLLQGLMFTNPLSLLLWHSLDMVSDKSNRAEYSIPHVTDSKVVRLRGGFALHDSRMNC